MSQVVISYRRADTRAITGRLFDRLARHFGEDRVFIDIDDIPAGADWQAEVDRVIGAARVVVAVIGPGWAGGGDPPRLQNPDDPIRVELEAALRRKIPIVPVLADGAVMPAPSELPDTLKPLSARNAIAIESSRNFDIGVSRLIAALAAQGVRRKARARVLGAGLALILAAGAAVAAWLWLVPGTTAAPRLAQGQCDAIRTMAGQANEGFAALVGLAMTPTMSRFAETPAGFERCTVLFSPPPGGALATCEHDLAWPQDGADAAIGALGADIAACLGGDWRMATAAANERRFTQEGSPYVFSAALTPRRSTMAAPTTKADEQTLTVSATGANTNAVYCTALSGIVGAVIRAEPVAERALPGFLCAADLAGGLACRKALHMPGDVRGAVLDGYAFTSLGCLGAPWAIAPSSADRRRMESAGGKPMAIEHSLATSAPGAPDADGIVIAIQPIAPPPIDPQFCDRLKTVVAAAPDGFAAIATVAPGEVEFARLVLPGFRECNVFAKDGESPARYACDTDGQMGIGVAQVLVNALVDETAQCLGEGVPRNAISSRTLPGIVFLLPSGENLAIRRHPIDKTGIAWKVSLDLDAAPKPP